MNVTPSTMNNLLSAITKNTMMYACGFAAIGSFLFLIYAAVYLDVHNEQIVNLLIGQASGMMTTMFAFYFGSSRGSDRKTEIMADQTKNP